VTKWADSLVGRWRVVCPSGSGRLHTARCKRSIDSGSQISRNCTDSPFAHHSRYCDHFKRTLNVRVVLGRCLDIRKAKTEKITEGRSPSFVWSPTVSYVPLLDKLDT